MKMLKGIEAVEGEKGSRLSGSNDARMFGEVTCSLEDGVILGYER